LPFSNCYLAALGNLGSLVLHGRKVRRPGISARIEADLRLIEAVVRLIGRLPSLRLIPLRPAIEELGACIKRQLDFRLEAAANRRLRSALVWEPGVLVPALVEELCSTSILTMDFVEGMCNPGQVVREASQNALLAALRALYRMIFVEGFVHCDLHQGNLHFLSDGRAVVIDFGFMAELQHADRLKFAEYFYAMATNDGVR
jgi:ubiquinone biosynthesis protein